MSHERWRHIELEGGRLCSVVSVTEPCRKRWWQFWKPQWQEREYIVEPFTGRMTPL